LVGKGRANDTPGHLSFGHDALNTRAKSKKLQKLLRQRDVRKNFALYRLNFIFFEHIQ